jgi:hypothetical protein
MRFYGPSKTPAADGFANRIWRLAKFGLPSRWFDDRFAAAEVDAAEIGPRAAADEGDAVDVFEEACTMSVNPSVERTINRLR